MQPEKYNKEKTDPGPEQGAKPEGTGNYIEVALNIYVLIYSSLERVF